MEHLLLQPVKIGMLNTEESLVPRESGLVRRWTIR